MLLKIPIREAEFVMAQGELTYQEILDDFISTDYVFILTYNISARNTNLINTLETLPTTTTVDIITNIPNRFETYYGKARNRAREVINVYLNKLDPENFDSIFSTHFNFKNHAKIIMTNNIVFIGSSNFSDESANNIECGIISRDADFISTLKNSIVPRLKENSEEYYSDDSINKLRIEYKFNYYLLSSIIEEVRMSCHSVYDERGMYHEFLDLMNSYHFSENLDKLTSTMDDFESTCYRIMHQLEELGIETEDINQIVEDLGTEEIQLMYSTDTSIDEFLSFNNQEYAMEYINENEHSADFDDVDEFRASASQIAYEKESELAELAETDVEKLLEELDELKDKAEDLLSLIPQSINENIDNT
ncbi:phospholipase D-like domain-containing protein [Bacillus atrophaeus]|uniref:hypothetical protein n=1 Tax=Bacillus atrophaeus TaxID=1452 RepID=UPI002DB928AD|nr:hypothetical protein [Bacillus atrophaeus]MEC2309036.1 hypothetical protein [Bacillus atrophaeus]